MTGSLNDEPKHWRERAKEVHAHADKMTDRDARSMMLGIVDSYNRLASMLKVRSNLHRAIDLYS